MDLTRQEYPNLLASLQPAQAVNVLSDRVKQINKINIDIADWLARRRVEEVYAQGLRRLARKPLHDGGALGIFQTPWQRIVASAEDIAQSHENFAAKIDTDVESPLRQFASSNREMQSMSTIQGNLQGIAKEIDGAQRKADKARHKPDRATHANGTVEDATSQWDSQAPFVFEQLQAADETRLNHLRDVLTQYQTHEADQIERSRATTESCLNALLTIDTGDEIKIFAARTAEEGTRAPTTARRHSSSAGAAGPPMPPPPRLTEDRASSRGNLAPPQEKLKPVASREEITPQTSRNPPTIPEPLEPEPLPPPPLETDQDQIIGAPGPATNGVSSPPGLSPPSLVVPPTTAQAGESAGPSIPAIPEQPSALDAISQAQQEAAVFNGENEDALRNLKIRDQPIQEDEGEAKEALDSLASQLRLQAQTRLRPQSSMRGRRDVRNTIFIPNPEPIEATDGSLAGVTGAASPIITPSATASPLQKKVGTSGTIQEDRASDANSIHSSHTLSSISGAFAHPDLHEPGLNASIVETVNTWFVDGAVSKSFATGEIALAYTSTGGGDSQSDETIRLDNFQFLEKVAANPAFVSANVSEKEEHAGEYSIHLPSITKPTPTVALKYQLHLDAGSPSAYSPMFLTPAWQIQDTQASVIIGYSLNPSFHLPEGTDSITFRNFALTVSLDISGDNGKAVNAMMAPTEGASFKRKHSAIVWKLPELVVTSTPQRLLARFMTAAPPKAGHIETKWELQGQSGSSLGVSVMSGASTDIDPFADETVATPTKTWASIPVTRKLVTGRYSA
ncbi:putative fes cip4 homology domain protein [Phaeomoniella chlamydospora]|uniref:Putative fes cip4 homology domain protein n=1 Tax=Phaeomoniella chlamydospora TaxID=158046 RepID=A0A0G2E4V8_PHACM|nr:putative fes cip4 homology domain protein [Phaeomoniella chlamydospora]